MYGGWTSDTQTERQQKIPKLWVKKRIKISVLSIFSDSKTKNTAPENFLSFLAYGRWTNASCILKNYSLKPNQTVHFRASLGIIHHCAGKAEKRLVRKFFLQVWHCNNTSLTFTKNLFYYIFTKNKYLQNARNLLFSKNIDIDIDSWLKIDWL